MLSELSLDITGLDTIGSSVGVIRVAKRMTCLSIFHASNPISPACVILVPLWNQRASLPSANSFSFTRIGVEDIVSFVKV